MYKEEKNRQIDNYKIDRQESVTSGKWEFGESTFHFILFGNI